jgi:hypothetical protein
MLEPNKSKRKRRTFLAWDLEWYPGSYQLRMAGVFDGKRYRYYTSIHDFLDRELNAHNNGSWFFAHAGGLADMAFVFEEIAKMPNVVVDARFSGSSAIIVEVQYRGFSFWFVDSFWLLRDKLRKIGEALGILKGGEEGNIDIYSAPLEELAIYNEQDCFILWTAIKQFEDLLWDLGGQLHMTIASCAMNLFRRVFLTETIKTSAVVNLWAGEAYHASRVEPFKPVCVDADYWDINSSFPYAMTFPAPGNVKAFRRSLPDHELYIAECEITVPKMHLPPLPYRAGARVYYPTGSWRAWFTGVDLQLLLKRGGTIHKVHSVVEFHPNTDLKQYAETIYALRLAAQKAGNTYMALVLKYLMNSCYGKFSESETKQKLLVRPRSTRCPHDIRCPDDVCMRMLFPGAWILTEQVQIDHRHVPFAGHITAIARRTLEGFLVEAKDPYYSDSVSADRTVVLLSPQGRVHIRPVEHVWNELEKNNLVQDRGKEFLTPTGWKALAMDTTGKQGWFPLQRLIRHKVAKTMWRISNKLGQTETTEDHGLMLNAADTASPKDFLEKGANFVCLKAPPSKRVGERIDLFEFLKDFHMASKKSHKNGAPLTRHFVCKKDRILLAGVNKRTTTSAEFKRFYNPGSPAFHALLRVIAAYLSEGSASLRGTTSIRDLLSIAQNNVRWLTDLIVDLRIVAPVGHFAVMPTGGGTYAIRSGTAAASCFFAALGGFLSENKRLPSFIYDLDSDDFKVFWRKISEGDGHVNETGQDNYTTKSQELAAGLSYVLDQNGIEHRVDFRTDKECYSLGTRPAGRSRNRKTTHVQVREPREEEWVYDLSVEGAHTFVDGIGRVLLHNTDSIVTHHKFESSTALGGLKLEKHVDKAHFAAAKVYKLDGEVKAKGFPRLTIEGYDRIVDGWTMQDLRMLRIREMFSSGNLTPREQWKTKALRFVERSKRQIDLEANTSQAWTVDACLQPYKPTPKEASEMEELDRLARESAGILAGLS